MSCDLLLHMPRPVSLFNLLSFLFTFTLFTRFLSFLFTESCGWERRGERNKSRVHGEDERDKQTEAGEGKVSIE